MLKKVFCTAAVAMLCTAMIFSAFATDSAADWDSLYYEGTPSTLSRNSLANSLSDSNNLLEGKSASVEQVAEVFALSINTIYEDGIESFARSVKSGDRMADMLDSQNVYMTKIANDTVIMSRSSNGYEAQVIMNNDGGKTFSIDGSAKAQLNSKGIKATANTTVKCVGIPGAGTAILFSDDQTEYLMFTVSRLDDLLNPGIMYTVEEVATIMDANKEMFALPEMGDMEFGEPTELGDNVSE